MTTTRPESAPGGNLAELLSTEARLDARVAAARAEADRLVAAARTHGDLVLAGLAAELDAAAADHRLRHGEELARRRAELKTATAKALHRLDSLTDADVAALAEWLAAEVIDPAAAAP